MNSPIFWYGGKGNLKKQILPHFPPHHTYVEPFGGGASLLFAKKPSKVEVYNDINSGLVSFFRVLRDDKLFPIFHKKVQLIPYSREEYNDCRIEWYKEASPVNKAIKWFVVARQSFGGRFDHGWGSETTTSRKNMASTVSHWLSNIENLPEIHKRIMQVQIEHKDFRDIIKQYDTENTLFYCDPPYVLDTRDGGEKYKHELTGQDHKDLVTFSLRIKGKSVISCYYHDIYKPLIDNGFERYDIKTVCYAAGKTKATGIQGKGSAKEMQSRTETILVSPIR